MPAKVFFNGKTMDKNFLTMLLTAMLTVALLAVTSAASAGVKTIDLPPDGVQLKPSTLPGYEKARTNCVACHSAEYMQYQPPTAARPYWENMTKRMKAVFNAPLNETDIPDIVDYLVKTYGNEQPK
jgi:mono/diheme cytochrome c family protein